MPAKYINPDDSIIQYDSNIVYINRKYHYYIKTSAHNIVGDSILFSENTCYEIKKIESIEQSDVPRYINTIFIRVTNECNINCSFCSMKAKYTNKQRTLNVAWTKESLISFIEQFHPKNIIITGGEPLLVINLIDILSSIREVFRGKIVLQTNGILIDIDSIDILSKYIDQIDYSAGHIPAKISYDTFNKIIIASQKKFRQVKLTYVYDGSSIDNLYHIIDIAAINNITLSYNFISPIGCASEIELLSLTERLKFIKNVAEYICQKDYCTLRVNTLIPNILEIKPACNALGNKLSVDIDGNIYICPNMHMPAFSVGSMSDSNLVERFNELITQRHVVKSFHVDYMTRCKECDYRYLCQGICGALDIPNEAQDIICQYQKIMLNYTLFIFNKKATIKDNMHYMVKYLESLL